MRNLKTMESSLGRGSTTNESPMAEGAYYKSGSFAGNTIGGGPTTSLDSNNKYVVYYKKGKKQKRVKMVQPQA